MLARCWATATMGAGRCPLARFFPKHARVLLKGPGARQRRCPLPLLGVLEPPLLQYPRNTTAAATATTGSATATARPAAPTGVPHVGFWYDAAVPFWCCPAGAWGQQPPRHSPPQGGLFALWPLFLLPGHPAHAHLRQKDRRMRRRWACVFPLPYGPNTKPIIKNQTIRGRGGGNIRRAHSFWSGHLSRPTGQGSVLSELGI